MLLPKKCAIIFNNPFFSYHFFHSIALLATPLTKRPYLTGSLMLSGMLFFSGTCYWTAFTNDESYNRLAPLGNYFYIFRL